MTLGPRVLTSHLGFLVLSIVAGLIAAGFVALIDGLLRRHEHYDRDATERYDELPALERRQTVDRRQATTDRRQQDRRVFVT